MRSCSSLLQCDSDFCFAFLPHWPNKVSVQIRYKRTTAEETHEPLFRKDIHVSKQCGLMVCGTTVDSGTMQVLGVLTPSNSQKSIYNAQTLHNLISNGLLLAGSLVNNKNLIITYFVGDMYYILCSHKSKLGGRNVIKKIRRKRYIYSIYCKSPCISGPAWCKPMLCKGPHGLPHWGVGRMHWTWGQPNSAPLRVLEPWYITFSF